jgi:hypothetical protein
MLRVLLTLLLVVFLLSLAAGCEEWNPPVWNRGPFPRVSPDTSAVDSLLQQNHLLDDCAP